MPAVAVSLWRNRAQLTYKLHLVLIIVIGKCLVRRNVNVIISGLFFFFSCQNYDIIMWRAVVEDDLINFDHVGFFNPHQNPRMFSSR